MSTTFPIEANYSFRLNVDGFEVKVTYKRSAYSDCFDAEDQPNRAVPNLVHFAFYGLGHRAFYKSHFTYTEVIEQANNCPYELANLLAKELYEEAKANNPQTFSKQYNLFQ